MATVPIFNTYMHAKKIERLLNKVCVSAVRPSSLLVSPRCSSASQDISIFCLVACEFAFIYSLTSASIPSSDGRFTILVSSVRLPSLNLTEIYSYRLLPPDICEAMRLLRRSDTGEFALTQFRDEVIPPYAILSHTWTEGHEVTFRELEDRTGPKAGYDKINFCGQQAERDGLGYFWVDTCCTIQTHHRRQRPTKRVAYAAENGGRMYIAFQYKRINISVPLPKNP
ncbi:uncharacterized protein BDR25DRAFT_309510 [Lindgomyces ingoldianus]|uniref:Uncharacterized protein n=1 Tax=Lindgomyces ingoldianus TaxID=673940 RepID=A0ACB6RDQ6_9PLEO|nr:uncharacterized protein BDR25DRAFT_309510 [Lindgomyces ingoldianus]KAF2477242.1 hypothetical protein BDR25DRAFT_309510 [Lindgomyces ingoldianus]